MGRPEFRTRAYLVSKGVSMNDAFTMDDVWADALAITFGELDGGKWSWGGLCWEDPK